MKIGKQQQTDNQHLALPSIEKKRSIDESDALTTESRAQADQARENQCRQIPSNGEKPRRKRDIEKPGWTDPLESTARRNRAISSLEICATKALRPENKSLAGIIHSFTMPLMENSRFRRIIADNCGMVVGLPTTDKPKW